MISNDNIYLKITLLGTKFRQIVFEKTHGIDERKAVDHYQKSIQSTSTWNRK